MKKKELLVIFKTHLDVGFTDYAENVVKKYLTGYIPNAIRVGNALKDSGTPFIWTVGSWLIDLALKNDADGTVEQAIRDGILNWHALPFTTHTELMNPALLHHALQISQNLDRRFGQKTIAAKMTDVPGHTIGMVPMLADCGVQFLHIGVNPATPVPPVPPVFRWKYGEKSVIVMYQGDYGEPAEFDDFILCFAHTGDNRGPQSAEEIVKTYAEIQAMYPDAVLKPATLNDVAERIARVENLPVVEQEIGDTWIHGAATDPMKLSRFRHAQRHIAANGAGDCDLADHLLLVPEHTWGMDLKTFFHNDRDYYPQDLAARKEERQAIEKSWAEQRAYVEAAEQALGITPDYPATPPDLTVFQEVEIPADLDFEISWQIFDNADYARYNQCYLRCRPDWAIWDFTKVGLPDDAGGICQASVTKAYRSGDTFLYRLEFPADIARRCGLPCFYLSRCGSQVEVKWFGKLASRLPQACWLKFKGLTEDFELNKMGVWLKPDDIIGSPLICAVDEGVRNEDCIIRPLDSALVAPYGRRLLQYGCTGLTQDLYFNLYNNIWNTNFPMWYEDDAVFRFTVEPRQ